jgi:hypothetical protein
LLVKRAGVELTRTLLEFASYRALHDESSTSDQAICLPNRY